MIVLDANILLYAYDSTSPFHRRAREWVEDVLSEGAPVGLPWQTAWAFLRIITNPRLGSRYFSLDEAAQVIERWIAQPNVRMLAPGEQHWAYLRRMMIDGQASGPLMTDAQLAALTMEFGGVLHTTDRDFARFPELRWTNPLG